MKKLTLFNRVKTGLQIIAKRSALQTLAHEIVAFYEAGRRWSPRRSNIPGEVADARVDASQMTRLEILRKARYFEANNAIANRLLDLLEQYTVGPNGLVYVPASSDTKWNANLKAWMEDWYQFPEVSSLFNWGTTQTVGVRSWGVDGECFIKLTNGKVREGKQSFPRIQLLESHRIETPPMLMSNTDVVDGLQLDPNGRTLGYHVNLGGVFDERFEFVPAENMVHLWEPSRPGQLRGLSLFYPILNDLHDLDDLQLLEIDAAKDNASITRIIQTKTGELSADEARRARFVPIGAIGTGKGSENARLQYYEDVFRGRVKALKHGDAFSQFGGERPSELTLQLWDQMTTKVCCGFGVSKLLVMPFSMQGTVVRADLDVSAAFFRSRSAVAAYHYLRAYRYASKFAWMNEKTLYDKPGDWYKVKVRPPRSVTVDIGRNSNALINEYAAGWRTLEEICGELGADYEEVLRQRSKEMKLAREIEIEDGLPEGVLIQAVLEAIKSQPQQATEPQQQVA
jgi:capsid protein